MVCHHLEMLQLILVGQTVVLFYYRRRSLLKCGAHRGHHDGDLWSKTLDFRLIIKNYT